jgi:hypothetical protein
VAVGGDGFSKCLAASVGLCRVWVRQRPDDEREGAVAVLFDTGLAVGLVLAAFGEQCRDVLGAQIDFDEPGAHEVVGCCGLGVEVGLERAAGRAESDEGAPGGWFDGAVGEVDLSLAIGLDQRDVGVGDGQAMGDEAGRRLCPPDTDALRKTAWQPASDQALPQ